MSAAEEKLLWQRYKTRQDEDAREQLILRHMRIVYFIAGRMAMQAPEHVDQNDLVGWGMMGLLDAVDRFDPAQETKFSTYASIRIRGAIIDQIRSLDWAPRSLRSLARQVAGARDKLRHELGREPSVAAIAEALNLPPAQVEHILAQLQAVQVLSLDAYAPSDDEDGGHRPGDAVAVEAPDPAAAAAEQEKKAWLVQEILQLPEQQQKVLNLYYFKELTLKEIGVVLNVTESRVSQIHSAAVKQLRKAVQEVA